MSVRQVPLGEICDILSGFAWSAAKFNQDKRGVPIIRIQNVDAVSGNDFVYWEEPFDDRYLIHQGDLLLTLSGSFRVESWAGPDALLNQRIVKLTPNPCLHARWLLHVLRPLLGQIERLGKHALVNNVSLGDIRKLKISLPPVLEQTRMVEILDNAEALRAKRRAALAQVDSLTHSIFLDVFGDPAVNQKGWSRASLASVCASPDDIKCGPFGTQLSQHEFQCEGVPLWGIKNVNRFFELPAYEFLESTTARRLEQYSIEPGDIVMTRKGTVGNCAVYPESFPRGIMHSDLLRVRVNREICEPVFLAHQLHSSRDVERQLALISGGAVMPGINVTRLKGIEVVVPPIKLQREFARRVAAVQKLKAVQRASLAEMDALFASLQHRAFNGQL